MSAPTLTVELDGQQLPLARCFWVLADPNGCVYGSVHGDQAVDAETAHRRLTRLQRDRDRQTRQGWTVQLLSPEQWDQQAKRCFLGTCQHRDAGREADRG
ncbi:hypothetical protein [Streptomyces sp. SCSIO ZS0520]|uniref:hypothetical protein n=1 Tax=Streptomyces sp. SCSIO ZS0520 TaxID=2892996 RepID=UPI0021DA9981|nr:hypothetical protein [Streptomyces sp. SCSIO ZS0520]